MQALTYLVNVATHPKSTKAQIRTMAKEAQIVLQNTSRTSSAVEALNKVVEGWTEKPDGLICNRNEGGGIIDLNPESGEWFVIFNDDRKTQTGFASREAAVVAFIAASK